VSYPCGCAANGNVRWFTSSLKIYPTFAEGAPNTAQTSKYLPQAPKPNQTFTLRQAQEPPKAKQTPPNLNVLASSLKTQSIILLKAKQLLFNS
jgi:hypothetical protein